MVTASHNPKRDDGYKLYWGNGVQIIPPHDAGIYSSILENLAPWMDYSNIPIPATVIDGKPIENLRNHLSEEYFGDQLKSILNSGTRIENSLRKIAYTGII